MGGGGLWAAAAGRSSGDGSGGGSEGSSGSIGIDEVISTLTETVAPESWANGAQCRALGSLLVIRQTEENHREIEALLLALRRQGGTPADAAGDGALVPAAAGGPAEAQGRARRRRGQGTARRPSTGWPRETGALAAQVACLDGRRSRWFPGRTRTVVMGRRR